MGKFQWPASVRRLLAVSLLLPDPIAGKGAGLQTLNPSTLNPSTPQPSTPQPATPHPYPQPLMGLCGAARACAVLWAVRGWRGCVEPAGCGCTRLVRGCDCVSPSVLELASLGVWVREPKQHTHHMNMGTAFEPVNLFRFWD